MPGTILLERSLPLDWRPLDAEAQSLNTEHNHLVFSLLDNLDEPAFQKSESEHASELMRLDAKLNVIMQLLGQLLQSRQSPQAAVAIRFSSDTLAWRVAQAPAIGSRLQVSLYPDQTIPLALRFEARVLAVTDQWMEVDMHGLGEDEQASWSRWVFRQHRRQVAQARSFPTAPQ